MKWHIILFTIYRATKWFTGLLRAFMSHCLLGRNRDVKRQVYYSAAREKTAAQRGQPLLSSRTYPGSYKHKLQLFSSLKESRNAKSNQSSGFLIPYQLLVSSPHSRKRGGGGGGGGVCKSVLCILLRSLSWLIIYNSNRALEALNAWRLILPGTAERYTQRAQNPAPRSLPTKKQKNPSTQVSKIKPITNSMFS